MTNMITSLPRSEFVTEFPFFGDADIRTALADDGGMWFAARDVATALDVTWSGATLRNVPEEWVSMLRCNTENGFRELQFINEPALYQLIFKSRKPKAIDFANWVCGTVLPAIRKHGAFGALTAKDEVSMTRTLMAALKQLDDTKDAFATQMLISRIRRLSQMLHEPMPDVAKIGTPRGQLQLGQS